MKHIQFILYILLSASFSWAQNLTGNVFRLGQNNKYEPLPNAALYWLNTDTGVETDSVGHFSLPYVAASQQLVISYPGFVDDTLLVKPDLRFLNHIKRRELKTDSVLIEGKRSGSTISALNPQLVESLNQKELYKAACCNLGESFQTNASVEVSYQDAATGTRQIRLLGLSGNYSQILTENSISMGGIAGMYALSYIPGPWMERIDIAKGASSVLNGYEGLTGQINVEYKKPEHSPKLFFNAYLNQMARTEASLNYATHVGKADKIHTMLMLHANTVPLMMDRNKDGFADEHLQQQFILHNRWTYFDEKGRELQFSIKHLEENRQAGQVGMGHHGSQHPFVLKTKTSRTEVMQKMALLDTHRPYKSLALVVGGVRHRQENEFVRFRYAGMEDNLSVKLIHENIIGNTNHKIRTGLSYRYTNFSESLIQDKNLGMQESVPGAFGEYTYSYFERLSVVAGFRSDYHNRFGWLLTPRMHLRYMPTEKMTVRLSAGRGMRTPRLLADNMGLFVSGRQISMPNQIELEKGWNYGLSVQQYFKIAGKETRWVLDAFRTDFQNQYVAEREVYNQLHFYYTPKSHALIVQAEGTVELTEALELKAAYKWNQVRALYGALGMLDVPFVPKQRALLTATYTLPNKKWVFDATAQWVGKSRIPSLAGNEAATAWTTQSPAFFQFFGQITRNFKHWELYLGGENLSNYTQKNPIINAANPYSPDFDATMVWGPIYGANAYLGVRWKLD